MYYENGWNEHPNNNTLSNFCLRDHEDFDVSHIAIFRLVIFTVIRLDINELSLEKYKLKIKKI